MWLSLAALFALGAFDMVSMVIRGALVQLDTPDDMRGRVSAVNAIFINTSNQLGEFESGMLAAWLGAVGATVIGGIGTLVVVGLWMAMFPTPAAAPAIACRGCRDARGETWQRIFSGPRPRRAACRSRTVITTSPREFLDAYAAWHHCPMPRATARAAFLVAPAGFALAAESARDNRYMDMGQAVDPLQGAGAAWRAGTGLARRSAR